MDSSRTAVRELSRVGRTGKIELTFGVKDGRTIIRNVYSEVPHKITRLYYPKDSSLAQLILMNTTAGLFGGDCSEVRILVESGARVLLTSQSSIKLHPGESVAVQSIDATVESGAELHICNDPLIPFHGSRLRQRITLQLAADAVLGFWDGFMAGRVGRGESWEFEEIDSETRLTVAGRLAYLERYRLHPSSRSPEERWVMDAAGYIATGLFYRSGVPDSSIVSSTVGVDEPFPGLAVIRAVAKTGTEYHNVERAILRSVWSHRGQAMPDARKNL